MIVIMILIFLSGAAVVGMDIEQDKQKLLHLELNSQEYILLNAKPLELLPYFTIKSGYKLVVDSSGNRIIDLSNFIDKSKESLMLVASIMDVIEKNSGDTLPKALSVYSKSKIVKLLGDASIKDIVLSIKLFVFFQAPNYIIELVCKELIEKIRILTKENLELDLSDIPAFNSQELKYFAFIKDIIIDVLSPLSASFKKIGKAIDLRDVQTHDPVREVFVPYGNLYAYLSHERAINPGVVYLIDLLKQEIKQSDQKHIITAEAKNKNTQMYAAVHSNIIASIVKGDDHVLFHSLVDTYEPIKLVNLQEKFTQLRACALSGDGNWFLALYNNYTLDKEEANYIKIYEIQNPQKEPIHRDLLSSAKNIVGCLFNPVNSDSLLYYNDSLLITGCMAYSEKEKKIVFEQDIVLDTEDKGSILGAGYSPSGDYMYALVQEQEKILCYRWKYIGGDAVLIEHTGKGFENDAIRKYCDLAVGLRGEYVFVELRSIKPDGKMISHLIKFDFTLLDSFLAELASGSKMNPIVSKDVVFFRSHTINKSYIMYFDCVFNKVISSVVQPQNFRALLGISADQILWGRTRSELQQYRTNRVCFDGVIKAIKEYNFSFEKYIELLYDIWHAADNMRLATQINAEKVKKEWYAHFIAKLPEGIMHLINSCSVEPLNKTALLLIAAKYRQEQERMSVAEEVPALIQGSTQLIQEPQAPTTLEGVPKLKLIQESTPLIQEPQVVPSVPQTPPTPSLWEKFVSGVKYIWHTTVTIVSAPFKWFFGWA